MTQLITSLLISLSLGITMSACSEPDIPEPDMTTQDEHAIPVPHFKLVNMITVHPGKRDAFIEILDLGTKDMPGNYAYIIREDEINPDQLWITEYWNNADSHKASLNLPAVQRALKQGRPMIADMKNMSTDQIFSQD